MEPEFKPWYFVVTRVARGGFPTYREAVTWAQRWVKKGFPVQLAKIGARLAPSRADSPLWAVAQGGRIVAIFNVESEARYVALTAGGNVIATGLQMSAPGDP